jgi:hypothetical protein
METENAIKLLDANIQNAFQVMAPKKLKYINDQLVTIYINNNIIRKLK